jgi:asparagine N-glycosylation enzyme membrane subunit Stt3
VVSQRFPNFLDAPPQRASLFRALYVRDGSSRRDADDGALLLPALERHRLVFESRGRDFRDAKAPPAYKLFEVVAGAEVEGRAAPGRAIDVGLYVTSNRGRRFLYDTQVVADAEGRYRVRLPYATTGGPPALKTSPFYRFSCGGEVQGMFVDEQDVQAGRELQGPDLCLESGGER